MVGARRLATIIQAVTHRPDWKPGNSIAILVSGSGKRIASAYRDGIGQSPRLVIDAETTTPSDGDRAPPKFLVRLFFAVPKLAQGEQERVFDVLVQGERVLEDLRLAPTEDGAGYCVHALRDVPVAEELHLEFVPKQGQPVISGIELVRQHTSQSQ